MNTSRISTLTIILLVIFSCSWVASAKGRDDFLECLSRKFSNYSSISGDVYTQSNSSFSSVLRFSIWNLRFTTQSTPKPQVIITPEHEYQIPPIIYCAKQSNVQIRTRSGGHDFEGLSYVAQVPFVIIDLIKLSEVTVDVESKTAWAQAGANLGTIYYRIAEKSLILGFPAGGCPTVGSGGHISGGGHGTLHRKYGLAADNIIDARIIDVNGKILDRKSMGEDLFWAIRGGGGASFGVIVAWKLQLVDVPEKVTIFTIDKTLEQNATQLVHRWQFISPQLEKDFFLTVILTKVNSSSNQSNARATFIAVFLGGADRLLPVMQEKFPELGLVREDCIEMTWIQSVLYIIGLPIESPETLLNRTQLNMRYVKGKSDYVQKPIPESGIEGIFRYFFEAEAEEAQVQLMPYGGRMAEISDSAIPFPHRAGNLYEFTYLVYWKEDQAQNSDRYISWIRRLYSYTAQYVSKSPRSAYINYRDLDIGVNNIEGKTSYAQASIWGKKYFNNNFDRLVRVKAVVDPGNFFRNEQSIPPLHSRWT